MPNKRNTNTLNLLDEPTKVINIGLEVFAKELNEQGVDVVQMDWTPPAAGDPKMVDLLSKLGTSRVIEKEQ